jgi:hypothetical protein
LRGFALFDARKLEARGARLNVENLSQRTSASGFDLLDPTSENVSFVETRTGITLPTSQSTSWIENPKTLEPWSDGVPGSGAPLLETGQQTLEIDVETQFLCRSKEIRSVDEQAVRKEVSKATTSLSVFLRGDVPGRDAFR